jgi:hypothetical protein
VRKSRLPPPAIDWTFEVDPDARPVDEGPLIDALANLVLALAARDAAEEDTADGPAAVS